MRWKGRRQSSNVEDRRGSRPVGRGVVGGGLELLAVVVISLFFGVDPRVLLSGLQAVDVGGEQQVDPSYVETPENARHREPTLVLFSGAVESGCGFAEAYVIAHEVGHHVQNLLGTSAEVQRLQQRAGQVEANQLSVRLELQADCYAGLWAHHADRTKGIREAADIEEALGAASAVGDDRLQRQARGRVVPDSFTHGTSEQRMHWFRRGLETGSLEACDTFSGE